MSDIFLKEDIQWPEEAFSVIEQDVTAPFLPPTTLKYTLVLDMDDTLVHCSQPLQQAVIDTIVSLLRRKHGREPTI